MICEGMGIVVEFEIVGLLVEWLEIKETAKVWRAKRQARFSRPTADFRSVRVTPLRR